MLTRSKHAGEDWIDYKDFTENNQDIVFQDNIEKLVSLIQEGFKDKKFIDILEIGCGNGVLIEKIAEKLKVLGIDFKVTMIEPHLGLGQIAYDRIIKNGFKVDWVKSTAEVFFPSSLKFDLIICTRVVHHLDDTVKVIKGMHESANKDAIIFIDDLVRPDSKEELEYWIERRKKTLNHDASLKMAEECLLASYNEEEIKDILKGYPGNLEIIEDWFKRWYYTVK